MNVMNQTENVKQQFSNDKNLTFRINFYKKYSTNKLGFIQWLFDKYIFTENSSILELGCGNGGHWEGRIELLPKNCKLVLSDFSEGMVNAVKEKYSSLHENVFSQKIDIQSIPFKDESFDVIIANHMLFHVPDLDRALLEVQRVLKIGGCFYSATDGNGGMRPFVHNAIKKFDPDSKAFTEKIPFNLQNGSEILSRYFSFIERFDYENVLAITKTQDLMEWLKSTNSISGYSEENIVGLFEYFESIRIKDGTINIPRETGLFVSIK
ncbi:MAG: methyltransferase domain-containing protein [Ardenticatenaceae bacterium]|nr:methyltransferase domain-containing protein [Ardenticatenaceae bacterium]